MALKDPKPPQDEEVGLFAEYWDDPEIGRLWVEEAERRYQELLDGKAEAIPGEEAIRRVRADLKRQRG
jgi:hypothetical protein